MKAIQIFSNKNLVVSNTLPMFAVPNHADIISSALYISDRIKAGFLFDNSTLVVLRGLATLNRGLASLYSYIFNSNFGQKMPNHDKNLRTTAHSASAATVNTRKRVTSKSIPTSLVNQSVKILRQNLEVSKILSTFVVRISQIAKSAKYTYYVAHTETTPLRQFCLSSLDWFAKLSKGCCLFCYIHTSNFFSNANQ